MKTLLSVLWLLQSGWGFSPLAAEPSNNAEAQQRALENDVVKVGFLAENPKNFRLNRFEVGQCILNDNGESTNSITLGLRSSDFPMSSNIDENIHLLNYAFGAHLGEKPGLYGHIQYSDLDKTLPLNAVNFFRHVQFATGFGFHGDVSAREFDNPNWAAGLDYSAQAFISRVLSMGPVLSVEHNSRTDFTAKAAFQFKYLTPDIILYGEIGGRSPFSKKTSDAYYSVCIDAKVCQIGNQSIYIGGEISNQELKSGKDGYWDVDPAKNNNQTQIKAKISVVY